MMNIIIFIIFTDSKSAFEMVNVCKKCVKQLNNNSYVQCVILRFIIEALFTQVIMISVIYTCSSTAAMDVEKEIITDL